LSNVCNNCFSFSDFFCNSLSISHLIWVLGSCDTEIFKVRFHIGLLIMFIFVSVVIKILQNFNLKKTFETKHLQLNKIVIFIPTFWLNTWSKYYRQDSFIPNAILILVSFSTVSNSFNKKISPFSQLLTF
jgi:hypothetical protein